MSAGHASHASALALVLMLGACEGPHDRREPALPAADTSLHTLPLGDVRPSVELPSRFRTIGRPATPAEVRAWDIDVNPAGRGLPSGRGTYERGAAVFAQQCASCHGARGEGLAANPRLIGREPRDFSFARDPRLTKTIGNYWPYATTLYDYINRAMPFTAPGSLPPSDVYSVIAFLLAENDIIERSTAVDAHTLPAIHMPARDRFVTDNRQGGNTFR